MAILFIKTIYIHCNYLHCYFNQQSACKYLLCMKLQHTCCCSCSYYTLMLLYVYMVIYSAAWPDLSSRRGAIACIISTYTQAITPLCELESGHVRLARSFMLSALPHGHFNPIASILLPKSFNMSV